MDPHADEANSDWLPTLNNLVVGGGGLNYGFGIFRGKMLTLMVFSLIKE